MISETAELPAGKPVPLLHFFSRHPLVGLIGSLASVAGVVLAILFYLQTSKQRELTYLVNPARAIVVKGGQTSRLGVLLDGKPFRSDVTAVQVAFWNNGNESIRKEHILKPLVIRVGGPIIDASIRRRTRDVTGITVQTTRAGSGELGVSWTILEKNDGGIIQIILAGGTEGAVTASAVIEGQHSLRRVEPQGGSAIESEAEGSVAMVFTWGFMVSGVGFLLWTLRTFRRDREMLRVESFGRILLLVPLIGSCSLIAMSIYLLSRIQPQPPFSF